MTWHRRESGGGGPYHEPMMNARPRLTLVSVLIAGAAFATPALAQSDVPGGQVGLFGLFLQSFDFFTVLLLLGSASAVTLIASCVFDIRRTRIIPDRSVKRLGQLIDHGRLGELRAFLKTDSSFPARVVAAAIAQEKVGTEAMRESAELAASEECARWFRRIEPLNVLGNIGPLVGLAGTVWGMILAFSALSDAGGSAMVGELAPGISKALFHTLLGLLLAIPCLLVFGLYRSIIDRICTHAMVLSSDFVDKVIELVGANGAGREEN
jgi:biopolymer transport protein ExbB